MQMTRFGSFRMMFEMLLILQPMHALPLPPFPPSLYLLPFMYVEL